MKWPSARRPQASPNTTTQAITAPANRRTGTGETYAARQPRNRRPPGGRNHRGAITRETRADPTWGPTYAAPDERASVRSEAFRARPGEERAWPERPAAEQQERGTMSERPSAARRSERGPAKSERGPSGPLRSSRSGER